MENNRVESMEEQLPNLPIQSFQNEQQDVILREIESNEVIIGNIFLSQQESMSSKASSSNKARLAIMKKIKEDNQTELNKIQDGFKTDLKELKDDVKSDLKKLKEEQISHRQEQISHRQEQISHRVSADKKFEDCKFEVNQKLDQILSFMQKQNKQNNLYNRSDLMQKQENDLQNEDGIDGIDRHKTKIFMDIKKQRQRTREKHRPNKLQHVAQLIKQKQIRYHEGRKYLSVVKKI